MLDFQRTGSGLVQAGDLQWRYLWGPAVDQILAEEAVDNGSDQTVQWTLTDHLNTVRDIAKYDPAMDSTSIVNHLVYDAFGQVTSESNPAVDSLFLFTARPCDSDTQLHNNLNRWYDPAVGGWLSEDPIGFAGGDGNLYRYVGNGPLLSNDWSGLAVACPGGAWIWRGTTSGAQLIVGFYSYSVQFTCTQSLLVGYWHSDCGAGCEFRQNVYKVPVAFGTIRVVAIGVGVDVTLFALAAGKVTHAPTSDDLAGGDWSVGVGVTAVVVGLQIGGGVYNQEGAAGLDYGFGGSLSFCPSYVSIGTSGHLTYEEPLRLDISNLIRNWRCERTYRPLRPTVVDTPSMVY